MNDWFLKRTDCFSKVKSDPPPQGQEAMVWPDPPCCGREDSEHPPKMFGWGGRTPPPSLTGSKNRKSFLSVVLQKMPKIAFFPHF